MKRTNINFLGLVWVGFMFIKHIEIHFFLNIIDLNIDK